MFEQAVLSNGPASKRVWTTFAGITGQAMLVTFAVMIPMIWPEAMPSHQTLLRVFSPTSPPPPPPPGEQRAPSVTRVTRIFTDRGLPMPRTIPPTIDMTVEPPAVQQGGGGVPGGVDGGSKVGIEGGILPQIFNAIVPAVAPPKATEHPAAAAPAPVPEIKRYRIGGTVHLGTLIHRVEPAYPTLARQMRVEGTVELIGVVGIDGRIRELQLKSGHPLLAPAAIQAVKQWVYEPTTLNGDRVEIIAPITVTFRLN